MKSEYAGKQVRGYAIGRKLHDGRVADVYSAQRDGNDYALKLSAPRRHTPAHHRLLERLCTFQHESLLLPVDVFMHYRNTVEVMPLVCHARLRACARELSYEDSCTLMGQLLSGLAYLHERGVRHGDAHAHNVFVDREASSLLLYDFCISREMRRARRDSAISHDMQSAALTFKATAYHGDTPKPGAPHDLERVLGPVADGSIKVRSAEEFSKRVLRKRLAR